MDSKHVLGTTYVLVFCLISAEPSQAQFSRRTPIVEAIQKTRSAIVAVITPRTPYQLKDIVSTGVIFDERGYVLTNHHVVGSHQAVQVQLFDGKKVEGQVLKAYPKFDLAILKLKTEQRFHALTLAPVQDLMVGETVIAVGHPYGFTNSVSVGIISALNRTILVPSGEELTGLIQTDASINPGNSGGPLLNINGEFIGINTAVRDGAQGISFAIHAGTIREILKKDFCAEKIAGVGHGLYLRDKVLSEEGDRQRVEIAEICQGTPAKQAGLRQGDIILAIGKCKVKNAFDMDRALWDSKPGQDVSIRIKRDTREMIVSLTLLGYRNPPSFVHQDSTQRIEARTSGVSGNFQGP